MSSCWGAPAVKWSAAWTMQFRSCCDVVEQPGWVRRVCAAATILASPHSSSAAFMASEMPSVKAMRTSPGWRRTAERVYTTLGSRPMTVPVASRGMVSVPRRTRGGLWPALT